MKGENVYNTKSTAFKLFYLCTCLLATLFQSSENVYSRPIHYSAYNFFVYHSNFTNLVSEGVVCHRLQEKFVIRTMILISGEFNASIGVKSHISLTYGKPRNAIFRLL